MDDYYSDEMNARREKFNNIINKIDMVLINNIVEVDDSIWDNWQGESPMNNECETEQISKDGEDDGLTWFRCTVHDKETLDTYSCEDWEGETEIYQWFAINGNDAEYLKDRKQYVTYSDKLDTYFLAITHFGTAWDYVDSMVDNILGDK